jgi:hypothetical protein
VSSTASPHPDGGLDVVVDPDGTLHVPAAELARHGVQPGSHLRIVTPHEVPVSRRSVRGTLTGTADVDALLTALDDAKSERITDIEQRWA